jgi:hypothetical protein
MEGLSADEAISLLSLPLKSELEPFEEQLQRLQHIHDFRTVENWPAYFKSFAKDYNLTYNPPRENILE